MLDVILYLILLLGFAAALVSAHLTGALVLTTIPTYDTSVPSELFTAGLILFIICFAALAYKLAKYKYHKPEQLSVVSTGNKNPLMGPVDGTVMARGNVEAGSRLLTAYDPSSSAVVLPKATTLGVGTSIGSAG